MREALEGDPQCVGLWLKRNPLRAAGVRELSGLFAAPGRSCIQVLDLINCGLMDEGVESLLDAVGACDPAASTLRHLYLSANGVTERGLAALRRYFVERAGGESRLETLFVGANRVGDEGAALLADAVRSAKRLVRLNVASSRIGARGAQHLARALAGHPSLAVLDLGYTRATLDLGEMANWIGDDGAVHLAQVIGAGQASRLVSLNVVGNLIGEAGVRSLLDAVRSDGGRRLVQLECGQFGMPLRQVILDEMRRSLDANRRALEADDPHYAANLQDILVPQHVKEIYSVYRTK